MNTVATAINKGVSEWKKVASVTKISKKYQIHRIIVGGGKQAIIILTGHHLEETSGPLLLLRPSKIKKLASIATKKNVSLILYPLVNNYGLAFSESSDEKLLRYNKDRINYNDGWGMPRKAEEVRIIEKDIKKLLTTYKVKCCVSLHEDSLAAMKGYLWMNRVEKVNREQIYNSVFRRLPDKIFYKMKGKKAQGGRVEREICIVDAKDDGAFENWMAEVLGVPTVLSEAPFGEKLERRQRFHLESTRAVIESYW